MNEAAKPIIDAKAALAAAGVSTAHSVYQDAIFDFLANGTGSGLVDALAGSGKSYTITTGLRLLDPKLRVLFCCFNKSIQVELAKKAPPHVEVSTIHSVCFRAVTGAFRRIQVDKDRVKMRNEAQAVVRNAGLGLGTSIEAEVAADVVRASEMAMNTLTDPSDAKALADICDFYDIELLRAEHSLPLVHACVENCRANKAIVTFDEMIDWVARGVVLTRKFDVVFIDEAQDVNRAQIEALLRFVDVEKGGRVIAVGDPRQSIYGFRGADPKAMGRIAETVEARGGGKVTVLPLNICYRCPTSHLGLAQALVPAIEARPGAPEGTVVHHEEEDLEETLLSMNEGDLAICRVNAPLVACALKLIAKGRPAYVQGRDIGAGLRRFVRDAMGKQHFATLLALVDRLRDFGLREQNKLIVMGREKAASAVQDKVDTVLALLEDIDEPPTLAAIEGRIERVFAEGGRGVRFSSVHRAKGMEAERVLILAPELLPHPMAVKSKNPQAIEQERNIEYVALTRAKSVLEFQPLGDRFRSPKAKSKSKTEAK